MTRILALDSSTQACSVAINVDGHIVEDFALALQDHTKRLLPMVDRLLANHQLSLRELDAIAFAQGPGSFTGLRICVGIVQGLAFGADLPVVPVSTLEAMALGARRLLQPEPDAAVVPTLDARMGEMYWGVYRLRTGDQRSHCLISDSVSSPADFIATLHHHQTGEVVHIVGSACQLLEQHTLIPANARLYPDCHPHAYDVARIAERLWRAGDTLTAVEARPVYIRNEVSWTKRQRIRSQ